MDTFVKRFFTQFEAPGAEFIYDNRLTINTYARCGLQVSDDDVKQNRFFHCVQPMTVLGIMTAHIGSGAGSLDGLTRQYITPEGGMNLTALADTLKLTGGMQTYLLSSHVGVMHHWDWSDNHTSLLVNMLRYCMIQKIHETAGTVQAEFHNYNDGHVDINMNQYWPADYQTGADYNNEWPGGTEDLSYPNYLYLSESVPTTPASAVDLRGMTQNQARFTLLMLAQWRRRSKLRLDFSTPKLVEDVYYRADAMIPNLDAWLAEPVPGEPRVYPPPIPTSDICWQAIKQYVTQNRLYDHFSTALYIIAGCMYQFVPSTAESVYWLSIDWKVSLPTFRSIRGRYTCLNEGEAALVSHRALSEWGYIGGKLEKIHLMALTFSQACLTGLAIRSIRKGLEDNPQDLYTSEMDFYQTSNFYSAAAAEAIRSEVPLPGMSGVYIYANEDFDIINRGRYIPIENLVGTELNGYSTQVRRCGEIDRLTLNVPYLTYGGFPTLIVPLNPCSYNTPFNLKGCIDASKLNITRTGTHVKPREMWEIANLARLCGYDTNIRHGYPFVGPSRYFAPNNISFVWPVLVGPDDTEYEIKFEKMLERENNFINLPPIYNRFFRGKKVDYYIRIMQRGVSRSLNTDRFDIEDYGGEVRLRRDTTVTYNIPEGVAKLRGYILRQEQGFRFVGPVQGGVIPSQPNVQPVSLVEGS
uniref:Coat protein n=1 Tax=Areca palm latent virus 1 TaxID=3068539 RepID=A0AA50A7B7_9VIRU|nr:putative coat protein [Areca palm latent virus 1]